MHLHSEHYCTFKDHDQLIRHHFATTADQVEDKEGETPLSMAAKHGKLRDLMVQVATGQMDVDEVL